MSRLYLDYVVDDDKVKKLSFRFGPELRAYLNEAKDRIGAQDEPFVRWATKVLLEFAESVNPTPIKGLPSKRVATQPRLQRLMREESGNFMPKGGVIFPLAERLVSRHRTFLRYSTALFGKIRGFKEPNTKLNGMSVYFFHYAPAPEAGVQCRLS